MFKSLAVIIVFGAIGFSLSSMAGVYSGALNDKTYENLTQQVEDAYRSLIDKISEAEAAGVETDYAQTTKVTVELFKNLYVPWDRANPTAHHSLWKERFDPLYRNFDRQAGVAVPFDELADCLEIIDSAITELQQQIDETIVLEDVPDLAVGKYALHGAYYELNERKIIPFKIFWQTNSLDILQAYGRMGGTYYGFIPSMLSPNEINLTRLNDNLLTMEEYASNHVNPIEFWHGTVVSQNQWPRNEHSDLFESGSRLFNHYDIDSPKTREWETFLFDHFLKQVTTTSEFGGGLRIHLLNNEPRFPIRQENRDSSNGLSDHTFAKFAIWLQSKYGSVATLNSVYQTQYPDFATASTANYVINDGVSESLQGGPIWYDWLKFNQERVNDWLVFLNNGVHAADPNGRTHIKIWGGGSIHRDYQDQGIDYEFLTNLVDITGSDSNFTPIDLEYEQLTWSTDWQDRYMFDWRQQSIMMDFIKSIAPNKPYFDSEWHGIDGGRWISFHNDGVYLRSALWLAASHGLSAINTWFLNRNADGSVKRISAGVNGTFATQPIMMDTYGRVMKEINAHADAFTSLVPELRHYVLYYCMDSAIQDVTYSDQMTDVYEALKLLNVPVGFTTASQLANVTPTNQTVLLPRTEFMSDKDILGLQTFAAAGGRIILVDPENCFQKNELGFKRGSNSFFYPFATINYDDDTLVMAEVLEKVFAPVRPPLPVKIDVTTASGDKTYGVLSQQFTDVEGHSFILLINAAQQPLNIGLHLESDLNPVFKNIITDRNHPASFTMNPQDSLLLKTEDN